MSPYNYCGNDPVNRFDPDGRTDYYSVYSGKLLETVDDNSDKKLFVLELKLTVSEAIENNAIFPIPNTDVLKTMDTVFDNTEDTGKEFGFQVDTEGNAGDLGVGNESAIDAIPYVHEKTGNYADYDVHSHPKPEEGGEYESNAQPSDTDMMNVVGKYPNVVLGYKSDAVGLPSAIGKCTYQTTRMIGWYTKSGSVGHSIPFSTFQNSVKKALRSK